MGLPGPVSGCHNAPDAGALSARTRRGVPMAMDTESPRSRRAILAAAAGAAGALAASAALPAVVAAHDPEDVQKGADNATTTQTTVTNSGADSTALAGHATGTGSGYGLEGTS